MKGLNHLSICILISFIGIAVCIRPPICQNEFEELWPHTNPNHFWYCHHSGSDPIDLPCPPGRGFLRNNERSGCVPYENWQCTTKITTAPSCTGEEFRKPHRHPNPNKFWGCEKQNGRAKVLNCAPGRAFVDNGDNLGCVEYENWVCNEEKKFERE